MVPRPKTDTTFIRRRVQRHEYRRNRRQLRQDKGQEENEQSVQEDMLEEDDLELEELEPSQPKEQNTPRKSTVTSTRPEEKTSLPTEADTTPPQDKPPEDHLEADKSTPSKIPRLRDVST